MYLEDVIFRDRFVLRQLVEKIVGLRVACRLIYILQRFAADRETVLNDDFRLALGEGVAFKGVARVG